MIFSKVASSFVPQYSHRENFNGPEFVKSLMVTNYLVFIIIISGITMK